MFLKEYLPKVESFKGNVTKEGILFYESGEGKIEFNIQRFGALKELNASAFNTFLGFEPKEFCVFAAKRS